MFKRSMFGPTLLVGVIATLSLGAGVWAHEDDDGGAVFALTNATAGNAVVAYHRASDGSLTAAGSYPTGGLGSGAGLGSQGAVIVTEDKRWLLAVNPGSNSISTFRIRREGLQLVDVVASGGTLPTSLAARAGLIYVLNAAALLDADGITAVTGGNPTDMAMSDDGSYLYVRVAALNQIAVFKIGRNGSLSPRPAFVGTPAGLAGLAGF